MASYETRVKADIARWTASGLLDNNLAERLSADIDARAKGAMSFGGVLAIFASLLFAAAILLLVAANWDVIPRIVRVVGLSLFMLGFNLGGALLKQRGHDALAEGAWIAGAGTFGAAIALIGQMYHLSGTEAAALITWSLGTALAAGLLRSQPLTLAACGIAISWLFSHGLDFWGAAGFPYTYPLLAAALWALSLLTRSDRARELLLLSLLLYLTCLAFRDNAAPVGTLLFVGSAVLFGLALFFPREVDRVLQLDSRVLAYGLLGALLGLALLQGEFVEQVGAFTLIAALTFGTVAAALVFAGSKSAGLRRIAYAGFAIELAAVYVITLGSMLDTVSFFLAAALVLGLLSVLILRFERRMADRALLGGGAA